MNTERLLTPKEAASRLSITIDQLCALVHDGEIAYIIVGRSSIRPRRRYTEADLQDFIERSRHREARQSPRSSGRRSRPCEVTSFSDLRDARLLEKRLKLTR